MEFDFETVKKLKFQGKKTKRKWFIHEREHDEIIGYILYGIYRVLFSQLSYTFKGMIGHSHNIHMTD